MLLKYLKVAGLLSFGPEGVDLPLRNLNVFIGPNGSGKSNLLEILALLRAAPRSLPDPVKEMGGVKEWLWKGPNATGEGTIEAVVEYPKGETALRHSITMRENGGRFEVANEFIRNDTTNPGQPQPFDHYNFRRGNPVLTEPQNKEKFLPREEIQPEESILSQLKIPGRFPAIKHLQDKYSEIRLFRNWSFGPDAALRQEQSASGRSDFLTDGGGNLALVLANIKSHIRKGLREGLEQLYRGIVDLDFQIKEGRVQMFVEEEGGCQFPATRLSDGTLRYLCLLAVLLHPEPPPLVAIEEPELGLHPDVVPYIAKLLVQASQRTQLLVTTHSQMLIDAMGDQPESVVVCDRADGVSQFHRLNAAHLKDWLEKYSLGKLWSMGEIGGNRW